MQANYVTVADFADQVGAEIARGRLESEGIPAFVTGGLTATTFSGVSNLGGQVELRVPGEHLAQAVRILAECGDADHLKDDVRAGVDDEEPIWLCPLCGDAVRSVLPLCPACHTPRGRVSAVDLEDDVDDAEEGVQTHASDGNYTPRERTDERLKKANEVTPGPMPPGSGIEREVETDFALPPLTTMVGDSMARRAFYAVVLSPFVGGLSTFYSIWLLIRLAFYRGELSARGMLYLYLALFFDLITVAMVLVIVFAYCRWLP
jgi:hypothetical protein